MCPWNVWRSARFLSTLSLRRATRLMISHCRPICISIHALLAESDPTFIVYSITDKCISIHALLAESDANRLSRPSRPPAFLSTLSLRRATWLDRWSTKEDQFLSTLSLRRATILPHHARKIIKFLSTLSLRRATISHCARLITYTFLSTLSLRRATHRIKSALTRKK